MQKKPFVEGEDNETDIDEQDVIKCCENKGVDDIVESMIDKVIYMTPYRQDGQRGFANLDDHKDVNDTKIHDIIEPQLDAVLEDCDFPLEPAVVISRSSNNTPTPNIGNIISFKIFLMFKGTLLKFDDMI